MLGEYDSLLAQLGCASMSSERVEHHLDALERVYDATARVVKSPYRFASDISAAARPVAIDGSRDLIEQGYHREAIFYIVATFGRCDKILYHDASPVVRDEYLGDFLALLDELGVGSTASLTEHLGQVIDGKSGLFELAEAIMDANPDVGD
jgi:hypothetical protein